MHSPINTHNKALVSFKAAILLLALVSCLFSLPSYAQCAMCRAVIETEEGGVKAEAVNDGIVYLMAFPYLLVGILGYIIYKSRQKKTLK